jgi:hypothetical protein
MDEDLTHPTRRVYDPGFGFLNKQELVRAKFKTDGEMRRAQKFR